jgi:hypothetical protein
MFAPASSTGRPDRNGGVNRRTLGFLYRQQKIGYVILGGGQIKFRLQDIRRRRRAQQHRLHRPARS